MVAGLKFLSKKSFNPQNLTNQKSVWHAEQESTRLLHKQQQRERQLIIERDHEDLAKIRDGEKGGKMASMRFMYDAPPGFKKDGKRASGDDYDDGGVDGDGDGGGGDYQGLGSGSHQRMKKVDEKQPGEDLFQRKSGDDDAAAAFRLMLAQAQSQNSNHDGGMDTHSNSEVAGAQAAIQNHNPLIISGSTAEAHNPDDPNNQKKREDLTQLERAVGKRNASSALTYQEQIARFPQLKHAPRALKRNNKDDDDNNEGGDGGSAAQLNFKPLGAQIRNVRCMACKIWGHSRGDRECSLSGWDPFAAKSTCTVANARGGVGVGVGLGFMKPGPSSSIMPDKKNSHGYYGPNGATTASSDPKKSYKIDMGDNDNRIIDYDGSDSGSDNSSQSEYERDRDRERRRRHKKKHRRRRRDRDRDDRKKSRKDSSRKKYARDRDRDRHIDRHEDDIDERVASDASDESDRRRRRSRTDRNEDRDRDRDNNRERDHNRDIDVRRRHQKRNTYHKRRRSESRSRSRSPRRADRISSRDRGRN